MLAEERLRELGIELPQAPDPLGSYVPWVQSGAFLFVSGMLPLKDGKLSRTGSVGKDVTVEEAREDAMTATVNALSAVKAAVGSLERVKRCVKITGYIASAPDFSEQPKVLNAASDLLFEVFGESGRHARAAIGVNVLPLRAPVEIEFVFEIG